MPYGKDFAFSNDFMMLIKCFASMISTDRHMSKWLISPLFKHSTNDLTTYNEVFHPSLSPCSLCMIRCPILEKLEGSRIPVWFSRLENNSFSEVGVNLELRCF